MKSRKFVGEQGSVILGLIMLSLVICVCALLFEEANHGYGNIRLQLLLDSAIEVGGATGDPRELMARSKGYLDQKTSVGQFFRNQGEKWYSNFQIYVERPGEEKQNLPIFLSTSPFIDGNESYTASLEAEKGVLFAPFLSTSQKSLTHGVGNQFIVNSMKEIEKISSDKWGSCALNTAGEVWCWGYGKANPVLKVDGAISLEYYDGCACALIDASTDYLSCWGSCGLAGMERVGFSNLWRETYFENPTPVAFSMEPKSFALGEDHLCIITSGGGAACKSGYSSSVPFDDNVITQDFFGEPIVGAMASTPWGFSDEEVVIPLVDVKEVTSYCFLDEPGTVYCKGENSNGRLGYFSEYPAVQQYYPNSPSGFSVPSPSESELVEIPLPEAAVHILDVADGACAQLESGRVFCWGGVNSSYVNRVSADGALGWDTERTGAPTEVLLDGGPIDLTMSEGSASTHHICGVHMDTGLIGCFGANQGGTVGRRPTPNSSGQYPYVEECKKGHAFESPWGATYRFAMSSSTTCAISASDRSVWCFGSNFEYGLGRAYPLPRKTNGQYNGYSETVRRGAFSEKPDLLDVVLILS